MIRKLLGVAVTLALPTLLAAQTPQIPNDHASGVAKAKVTQHRATRRQGEAVGLDNRPTWIATLPVGRTTPPVAPPSGSPPHPAAPATPPQKPATPGSQAGNHRP